MYYLALNQQKAGPFTVEQVRDHLRDGTATRQTLFWQEGQTDWEPLERLGALLDAPAAAPADNAAPPSAAATPAAEPTSAPAYTAPAAAASPVTDHPTPAQPPFAPATQPADHPAPAGYVGAPPAGYAGAPPAGYPGGQPPPGYPPAPYGQPPGGYPPNAGYGYPAGPAMYRPPTPTSGAAVASVVCGALSIFGCAIPFIGGILPLAAVICGHIALGNVRRAEGRLEGRGAAIAGLILGYLTLLVAFVVVIIFVIAIAANSHY